MKYALLGLVALMMAGPVALAGDKCGCNKDCAARCAKGDGSKCKCKTCDCAKTGKCKHGHCELKKVS